MHKEVLATGFEKVVCCLLTSTTKALLSENKRDTEEVHVRPRTPAGHSRTETIAAPNPHEHNHVPNTHHVCCAQNFQIAPDPQKYNNKLI